MIKSGQAKKSDKFIFRIIVKSAQAACPLLPN